MHLSHAVLTSGLLRLLLLPQNTTVADPAARYAAAKQGMERQRVAYDATWMSDGSTHDSLLKSARSYLLERISKELFPPWYGTPWDFNGTTRVPGQAKIACGYFVTTVLQDAGFRIPRIKWAQLAAEPMIRKLAPQARSFSNASAADVLAYVHTEGDGLFAVGLDSHVGFLLKQGNRVLFVHSNYYRPAEGVVAEPALGENPFAHSKYRVVGKLLNDSMVRHWILGAAIE